MLVDDARATLRQIGDLSAETRGAADSAREAEIVRARYDLGRELLANSASLPAGAISPIHLAVEDPFPGLRRGVPEVGFDELGVELLRGAIAHHGCLLVHGFFPSETMAQLRGDTDQVADAFDQWMASGQQQTTPGWFEPFEAPDAVLPLALRNMCGPLGTFYAADSPRTLLHLIDAFDAAGLPQLLLEYMNEPVLLGLEKTSVRRLPIALPTAWHQDGQRFGPDLGLVNVWVPLCHCGRDAPTLGVVPKRLREILPLDTESAVPWEIRQDALLAAAGDVLPVELVLEPGDAILFDEMLAHSTITNRSMTKPRYGADAWFFPVSAFPVDLYKPLAYAMT